MTIQEVFEQYKHLDKLLSDREWVGENLKDQVTFDLWQSVKEYMVYMKR